MTIALTFPEYHNSLAQTVVATHSQKVTSLPQSPHTTTIALILQNLTIFLRRLWSGHILKNPHFTHCVCWIRETNDFGHFSDCLPAPTFADSTPLYFIIIHHPSSPTLSHSLRTRSTPNIQLTRIKSIPAFSHTMIFATRMAAPRSSSTQLRKYATR